MLTPINVLNTELTPEMPANAGHESDAGGFQARLGEAMDGPLPVGPLQQAGEDGDALPPGGNNLPVDMQGLSFDQLSPTMVDEFTVIADEQAEYVAAFSTATSSTGESVSIARVESVELDPSILGSRYPGGPMAPIDAIASGRMGVRIEAPLPTGNLPILDANSTGNGADRLAEQPVDSDTRAAAINRLVPAEGNENAKQIVGAVAGNFRPLAEKPEGLQKNLIRAVSQSALVGGDNPTSLQGTSLAARAAPAPPVVASINIPVLDDAWGEALNERVLWMAGKSVQRAEIRLNPGDLGPIRIEVSIVDDTAKVSFNAQHAITREAIETALPRLREMLGENGISLTDTDVSDADAQHDQAAGDNDVSHAASGDVNGSGEGDATLATSLQSGSSSALVDTFV